MPTDQYHEPPDELGAEIRTSTELALQKVLRAGIGRPKRRPQTQQSGARITSALVQPDESHEVDHDQDVHNESGRFQQARPVDQLVDLKRY